MSADSLSSFSWDEHQNVADTFRPRTKSKLNTARPRCAGRVGSARTQALRQHTGHSTLRDGETRPTHTRTGPVTPACVATLNERHARCFFHTLPHASPAAPKHPSVGGARANAHPYTATLLFRPPHAPPTPETLLYRTALPYPTIPTHLPVSLVTECHTRCPLASESRAQCMALHTRDGDDEDVTVTSLSIGHVDITNDQDRR